MRAGTLPFSVWVALRPSASRFSRCRTSIPIIAGQIPPVKQPGWLPLTSPHKERRFIPRMNLRGFRARISVTKGPLWSPVVHPESGVQDTGSKACVTRGPPGMQEEAVMVSQNVLFALPLMRTRLARLRVVVGYRGGLGLGVLQHRLNLWPSQKARTQRLILDPLRQFLDDPGGRSPGGARLRRIARCLIQPPQCRQDLPLFGWQAEVCRQPRCLAQAVDGLLAVPLPLGQDRQRPQVGD